MSGDILQRIDASLDSARPHRCGCGCNTVIPPDGPSLYYVSADHQARAQRQLNKAPGRPDGPADTRVGNLFASGVPLAALREHVRQARSQQDAEQVLLDRIYRRAFMTMSAPCTATRARVLNSMRYTRYCLVCHETHPPVTKWPDDDVPAGPALDSTAVAQWQRCGGCCAPFAVPITAAWEYDPAEDKYVFLVRNGSCWARTQATERTFDGADFDAKVTGIWRRLTERILDRVSATAASEARFDIDAYLARMTGMQPQQATEEPSTLDD